MLCLEKGQALICLSAGVDESGNDFSPKTEQKQNSDQNYEAYGKP